MLNADIRLVIGTRPEAIKLKPVAFALSSLGFTPRLIFTGQHPHLEPEKFGLGAYPGINLQCAGREDPHDHVRAVVEAILPLLTSAPDLVIVQGDTSSALGGALAAVRAKVPLAHVEAGLRTHDLALPWPEEEYRTLIDAHAELLFAPAEIAAANLRAQRVAGQIHVTGNTAVDALLDAITRLPDRAATAGRTILVTCHRRESWRALGSIAAAIAEVAEEGEARFDVVLPPNAYVAENMRRLLGDMPAVSLIDACSHDELLTRMRDATLVLSDSGGIQEEAPVLGVPLLVLREKTERPEGIAAGNARLVGTDRERITSELRRLLADRSVLLAMSRPSFPFGDGHAGPRIAGIISAWLEQRSLTRRIA